MSDTPCGSREYCGRYPFCGCGQPTEEERDEEALRHFTAAMRAKLFNARIKGRGGWWDESVCSIQNLRDMLADHMLKGDPVDVANFCMFLHQRGAGTSEPPQTFAQIVESTKGNGNV